MPGAFSMGVDDFDFFLEFDEVEGDEGTRKNEHDDEDELIEA